MVTDAELCVTEDVFHALSEEFREKYDLDFSDDGNEIFLTNKKTNLCFTITVKQDE